MQHVTAFISIILILINPLTARVVGAPQMILQPVFSIFPCSPLPSGTCRTPGLSIPLCYLPTSSSVCLIFFPLSLCLARWFLPDLMNLARSDNPLVACNKERMWHAGSSSRYQCNCSDMCVCPYECVCVCVCVCVVVLRQYSKTKVRITYTSFQLLIYFPCFGK